ncbi:hypothetical protein K9N50_02415 [bacterium]|nr:hypothetical protein [bacterium]
MKTYQHSSNLSSAVVLPINSVRDWTFQLLMVGAAVVLPAVAHLTGAPVRWLLPMHWPVVLAALIYGWRGGLTVGALAPASNYLLTGYPLLIKAIPMTFELAVYGLIIGLLREKDWNSYFAVAIGLVLSRMVFLTIIILTGANEVVMAQYLIVAILPGLTAGLGQVIFLPALVEKWFKKTNINNNKLRRKSGNYIAK